jgi:hypothetical protein
MVHDDSADEDALLVRQVHAEKLLHLVRSDRVEYQHPVACGLAADDAYIDRSGPGARIWKSRSNDDWGVWSLKKGLASGCGVGSLGRDLLVRGRAFHRGIFG